MVTLKYYINPKRKKKDGTMTVKIIVSYKRKRRMLPTSINVTSTDITKTGKLRNQELMLKINTIIAGYSKRIADMGLEFEDRDVDYIVDNLKMNCETDFFRFVEMTVSDIRIANTKKGYLFCAARVRDFVERDTLDFREMGLQFFKAMERYLVGRNGGVTGGVVQCMRILKSIYRKAFVYFNSESNEVISPYPLHAYKLPSKPHTVKRALPIERIRALMAADLKGVSALVRDVYILSFCLMGMNLVDLYECEYTSDDVICYNRMKTKARRDDNAHMEIDIDERIRPLVMKYRGKRKMFNFSEKYSTYGSFQQTVIHHMRVIIPEKLGCEPITFYSARHSFATIAYNDCGIDKYVVHSMMNHVSPDMRVTDIYIKRKFDKENAANKRVLDLLFQE